VGGGMLSEMGFRSRRGVGFCDRVGLYVMRLYGIMVCKSERPSRSKPSSMKTRQKTKHQVSESEIKNPRKQANVVIEKESIIF
jgi:hypothetical protein